ncbi:hypothetical protein, partial [Parasutterella secunda]
MKIQSLTKITIAVLATLGALQAHAYVHESTGMDTQVDGIHEIDSDRLFNWKFIGANYDNNGPGVIQEVEGETQISFPIIDDYGDHSVEDFDANTYSDVAYTVTGQTLLNVSPQIEYVTIYGAGVVYGSVGLYGHNSATVDGDVTLEVRDVGSRSAPVDTEINIFGAGGVETFTGDASVEGNVAINIQNVYGQEVEIIGGGRVNGVAPEGFENYPTGKADVSGTVAINVSNSDFGQGGGIFAGGDAEGEGITANVGGVSVVVSDVTFDSETAEEPISAIFGGGTSYTYGTADVLGDVSIRLVRSSVDIVAGGGETLNDVEGSFENPYGKSAQVHGNVSIYLTDSKVKMLLGGGTTDGAIWGDDEHWRPIDGEYGDVSVGGDVLITVSGNSEVDSVYLAGSGVGSNVKGNSTLLIDGNNTRIGHIYGAAFNSEVEGIAKIAFGSDFNGTFDTPYEAIDELEALNGSNVAITVTDTEAAQGLTLSGAGNFNADIRLTSGTLTVNGKVNATALSLTGNGGLVMAQNGVLTTTTD